ncbi:MAG: phosphoenolpyruvate--protein phosphotransferase [Verrucomicrobia bacterium]|nr:phosphoenolpyruvate--protein phosphotransferase [Verrucomicrobiota bacterium]
MDSEFFAPLSGPVVPLGDVPDPVFAQRMAGDGLAIDPVDNRVLSPCDGKVAQVHRKRHAVTVVTDEGVELLIHVGIETVNLNGEGFEVRCSEGTRVSRGDPLLEFDADLIVRKAKSLITVVLVANSDRFPLRKPFQGFAEAGRTSLFAVEASKGTAPPVPPAADSGLPRSESEPITVEAEHGIHARPAAALADTARRFKSVVEVAGPSGRTADAKSVVALLGLEIGRGQPICIVARGADAQQAVEALSSLARTAFGRVEKRPPTTRVETVAAAFPPAVPAGEGEVRPGMLRGVSASPGLAVGQVAKLVRPVVQVPESAADPAEERRALQAAVAATRADIEAESVAAGDQQGEILLAHRIILEDPLLVTEAEKWIAQGKSAAWAWQRAARSCEERVRSLKSGVLAGRAADIEDVALRVIWRLTGVEPQLPQMTEHSILVAEDLPPSVLISLDRTKLAGFATVRGGPTSHVAILARSMALPAVAGLPAAALALSGDREIVLNGDDGVLETQPARERLDEIRSVQRRRETVRAESRKKAHEPAVTRDGIRIEVAANIGGAADAQEAVTMGADGVGLLRTEFLFLDRAQPPTEEEHLSQYVAITSALGDRPLIIRTLDLGGDKLPSYFPQVHEDNPSLGVRGVRLALERADLYRDQLRAILRIGAQGRYRVMLPLVSDVEEVRELRGVLSSLGKELGVSPLPEVGIMVETPAAAILSDHFAAEADFFSIGSNDLTQYVLAIDRGHPVLGRKLDSLHPAVLRAIGATVDGALLHNRWVGVCGAMASEPAAVPLLMGLGVTELSVSIPMVPEIKAQVRTLDLKACRQLAEKAVGLRTADEVRALVKETFPVNP